MLNASIQFEVRNIVQAYQDWMGKDKAIKMLNDVRHRYRNRITMNDRQYISDTVAAIKQRNASWDYIEA